MTTITLLEREQRQGTIHTGSHRDFYGLSTVTLTADMDAPELATSKSLTYWGEYYDHRARQWKQFGELHEWQGPTAATPSFVARVPPVEETLVRMVIDTGTDRINIGAKLTLMNYGD